MIMTIVFPFDNAQQFRFEQVFSVIPIISPHSIVFDIFN